MHDTRRATAPSTPPTPDGAAVSGPVPPVRRATVPLLVATALAVLVQLYVSIPLQPAVSVDLGGSVTAALAAGYALCYAAGFLVYGPLSDHVGRRPVLLGGLLVLTVATAAVGLSASTAALGALRAVQGAAAATFAPTALAMLGECLPVQRRARAIGAMSVAFLTAGIIGQVSASALAATFGWRWVFFVGAVVLGALTAGLALTLTETATSIGGQSLLARYAGLGRFAARPASILLGLGHLMVLGGFVAVYTLLGPHLAGQGLSDSQVMAVRAAALPTMFCSLLAGRITAHVGPATTVTLAFVTAALGLGVQAAGSGSVVALTAASVLFVAGISVAVPTFIALWGETSSPARGIGMAVNGFVLFLGASIGPYVAALPVSFPTALVLLAVGYPVAAVLVQAAVRLHHTRGGTA